MIVSADRPCLRWFSAAPAIYTKADEGTASLSTGARFPTISPTLSLGMTQGGGILAAYKNSEQARGTTVDQRADIWAFGVVRTTALAAPISKLG